MKKQELRHDAFRENVVKGIQYFNDNSSTVIKIFAVIVLVVGGMSYYNHLGSIKLENAAHLAGRAQNIFINGNLDEALVKFERVLNDYPNTKAAHQSLIYLLNNAISDGDYISISAILDKMDGEIDKISDPVIKSAVGLSALIC